jgi:hypothetical protein
VDTTVGLDVLEKQKNSLPLPGFEPHAVQSGSQRWYKYGEGITISFVILICQMFFECPDELKRPIKRDGNTKIRSEI